MVGIVWMVGLVCKFVGYGIFGIIIYMVYIIYIYILLLILRSSLTQSACAQFLEANFPKNLLLFWENWRMQT